MSVIFSASLFFMSFVPLWISILFIDVKSIVTGGEIRTEVISIIIIVTHAFISGCILWNELRPKQRSGEKVYRLVSCSEEKSISAEYLLSYILPLFAFDFTQWDQVVLFLIFYVTLAFLCIRHNYFSIRGCGQNLGPYGYPADKFGVRIPLDCLYSRGLIPPRESLIRFSQYQCRY